MSTPLNETTAPLTCITSTASDGTILCEWTGSPGTRGTWNILWLCLSTLGLCVWNAVHPDIPHPRKGWMRVLGKRIWWLIVGLFMPEMLVLVALAQFLAAYRFLVLLKTRNAVPVIFPWWMRVIERMRGNRYDEPNTREAHPWTMTHSFYAVMRGFVTENGKAIRQHIIIQRLQLGSTHPGRMPNISAHDIEDRSKADGLGKLLLIWQLTVFLANCAARWDQELPLSLLEITTLAHALCALVTLAFWWYKPHCVGEATVVGGITDALTPAPPMEWPKSWGRGVIRSLYRSSSKVLPGSPSILVPQALTMLAIALLYGLPHSLGWAVHFPTAIERLCWRIATFTVVAAPILTGVATSFMERMLDLSLGHGTVREFLVKVLTRTWLLVFVGYTTLYFVSSAFLVYESLRQVFALPERAFHEPKLIRYLPHIS